nr:NADH dehydrogenase subunit 3 [Varroa destructor]
MILLMFMFMISLLTSFKKEWLYEKSMSFECGFEILSLTRVPFSLHFFKICLIFIFFDIEIIIILPMPMIFYYNTFFFYMIIMVILIIMVGLYFEWMNGALNWIK